MLQTEYEKQKDPKKLPPGSVIIEDYSIQRFGNFNLVSVKTTGEWFSYACLPSGGCLYCLKDGQPDISRPSVFRLNNKNDA